MTEAVTAVPPDHDTSDEEGTDSFVVRNPIRVAALTIVAVTMAFRLTVLKDGWFITDDFMLTTRALENDLDWDYLTRVHTGHFEPVGFAVMWLLAHFAPLDWNVTVALLIAGQVVVAWLVWRLLCTLFGRRPLVLVPFALYCLTPLTLPAFTWLSAAIIWLPLMAMIAGALRHHVLYVRHGRVANAVGATAWLLFGAVSFEKFLVYLPYVAVFTLALVPETRLRPGPLLRLVRRTWVVWAGYAVVTAGFVWIYLWSAGRSDTPATIGAPTASTLSSFAYFAVLRNFVPAAFGGPWSWTSVSYGTGYPSSPPAFDWFFWVVATLCVLATFAVRRGAGRAWASLATYLVASMATLAVSRVLVIGSAAGLEPRYIADAALPLVVAVGYVLMALPNEQRPWHRSPTLLPSGLARRVGITSGSLLATAVFVLSLNSYNGYARIQSANPYRPFTEKARASVSALPAQAQIYDVALPVDIIGPLALEYNRTSRFLSPFATTAQRRDMYDRTYYTNPYYLTTDGSIVPMTVEGAVSKRVPGTSCGYVAEDGRIEIPLESRVFDWTWVVRVGYVSDSDTSATITLGLDSVPVRLTQGAGQVIVPLQGTASSVIVQDLHPWAQVCVGDVTVGNPAPR
ncbi:hypothetical protein BCF74_10587 [Knoellia remsis]|uniref:4-amino-4-deoxy-L-arabinose transferase-like glycosyltransferase n=1 Tax=Knoellia remsis TaxID=407159 RepID=A0A2T0UUB7_9MICO|nr:DUF2029 domain-containing protein [Knoellia remsis]PRY61529.1 hypothetical protein BCF74_10587 [Knoellia remsis]